MTTSKQYSAISDKVDKIDIGKESNPYRVSKIFYEDSKHKKGQKIRSSGWILHNKDIYWRI